MYAFWISFLFCLFGFIFGFYTSPLKGINIKLYPSCFLMFLFISYYVLEGCLIFKKPFFNKNKCYNIDKSNYNNLIIISILFFNCSLFLFLSIKNFTRNENLNYLFTILILLEIGFIFNYNEEKNSEKIFGIGKNTLYVVLTVFIIQCISFNLDNINKKSIKK